MEETPHAPGCARAVDPEATCACGFRAPAPNVDETYITLSEALARFGKAGLARRLLSGALEPVPNRGGFYLSEADP